MDLEAAQRIIGEDTLSLWVMPVLLILVIAEAVWSWRRQRDVYETSDTVNSMTMLVASILIELVPKVVIVAIMVEIHDASPLRDAVGRQAWAWVALFFLDDFTYYWFHRLNHEVRFLWAGHVNHHSSERMNLGTALRQGVGERAYKYVFWLWLALVGFDPAMILLMIGLNLTYQFWVHTEQIRRMPAWYEAVFNTPSHHRVHHGSNVRYLDRNHAGVLIIWDKLFGTFSPEVDAEPVVYGLTQNLEAPSPLTVLVHEYAAILRDLARARSLTDRLSYLLQPPGWSHDGPDKRAKTLRAEAGL